MDNSKKETTDITKKERIDAVLAGALLSGTPEAVYEEACEAIRISGGKGLILATGCDLASSAPLENVKMMGKACKDLA